MRQKTLRSDISSSYCGGKCVVASGSRMVIVCSSSSCIEFPTILELDFAAFKKAIRSGRLKADTDEAGGLEFSL